MRTHHGYNMDWAAIYCMSNSNTYPTVATIIGCPEQLSTENGLVATPLGISGELQPPAGPLIEDTSSIKDPIQRAIIDNICGNLPDRNPVEYIKCEVCNVDCNGKVSFRIHLSGAKHAKRVKEQEMVKLKELPYIKVMNDTGTYGCTICGAILNAVSQIQAHIEGNKHKSKMATKKTNACNIEIASEPGKPGVDATPNLLYCAACNIHVNSAIQFQQHTASKKHINKVNGTVPRRAAPYYLKKKTPLAASGINAKTPGVFRANGTFKQFVSAGYFKPNQF